MTSVNGRWIRQKKRWAIYMRDRFACVYCGNTQRLSLDHYRNRSNDASNLLTACLSCNSAKQGKSIRQWYRALRDRGVNTNALQCRVRRALARPLPYMIKTEHGTQTEYMKANAQ